MAAALTYSPRRCISMPALRALCAFVGRDSTWAGALSAAASVTRATGTDACAGQGQSAAPTSKPMHVIAFALATMASFPLRPPEKAKGRTEERRREDRPRELPPALSMPILPFPFSPNLLGTPAPPLLAAHPPRTEIQSGARLRAWPDDGGGNPLPKLPDGQPRPQPPGAKAVQPLCIQQRELGAEKRRDHSDRFSAGQEEIFKNCGDAIPILCLLMRGTLNRARDESRTRYTTPLNFTPARCAHGL